MTTYSQTELQKFGNPALDYYFPIYLIKIFIRVINVTCQQSESIICLWRWMKQISVLSNEEKDRVTAFSWGKYL
jgi:hypothetical protein